MAVSTIFFVNGAVLASWVPHIPTVKARHGASDAQLGFVLLTMAAGALFALPLGGPGPRQRRVRADRRARAAGAL